MDGFENMVGPMVEQEDLFAQDDGPVVDINIRAGFGGSVVLPKKNGKILLVDADTVIFTGCLNSEVMEELLPWTFYTDAERKEIESDPTYDPEAHVRYFSFDDDIDAYVKDKLEYMLEQTGCESYELHLTGGLRTSFRYTKIDTMYKNNRKGGRAPANLSESKVRWVENNPTTCFIHEEWEADDIVVSLKRDNPDKYIMAAVDKDVIYSVPGKHWNYFTSAKFNIDMKWVEVDHHTAIAHHYMQTLTGDPGDNIPGLVGIGPVKAKKILGDALTVDVMWDRVVAAYEDHGKTIIDAMTTMRLVNMHQLFKNKQGDYEVVLWKPTGVKYGTK